MKKKSLKKGFKVTGQAKWTSTAGLGFTAVLGRPRSSSADLATGLPSFWLLLCSPRWPHKTLMNHGTPPSFLVPISVGRIWLNMEPNSLGKKCEVPPQARYSHREGSGAGLMLCERDTDYTAAEPQLNNLQVCLVVFPHSELGFFGGKGKVVKAPNKNETEMATEIDFLRDKNQRLNKVFRLFQMESFSQIFIYSETDG